GFFAFIQAFVEKRQERIDVTEAASLIVPVIVQAETKHALSICRAVVVPHRQQEDAIVGWHVFDRVYRGCMTCNRASLRRLQSGQIPAAGCPAPSSNSAQTSLSATRRKVSRQADPPNSDSGSACPGAI